MRQQRFAVGGFRAGCLPSRSQKCGQRRVIFSPCCRRESLRHQRVCGIQSMTSRRQYAWPMVRQDRKRSCWSSPKELHNRETHAALTPADGQSLRQLFTALFSDHVLGIPLGPVRVWPAGPCFMLPVRLCGADHGLGKIASRRVGRIAGNASGNESFFSCGLHISSSCELTMGDSVRSTNCSQPSQAARPSRSAPFRASMALTLLTNAFSRTLLPIVLSTKPSIFPLRFLPSRMTLRSISVVPSA